MRLRKLIKSNAKLALHRHWCRASAIALIMLMFWALFASLEELMSAVFDLPGFVDVLTTPDIKLDDIPNVSTMAMIITAVITVLYVAVMSPLRLGVARWYYLISDGRAEPAFEIFEYFSSLKSFFGSIWFSVLLFFKRLFWCVAFLSAPVAMLCAGSLWSDRASKDIEQVLSLGLMILGGALFALMGLFLLIWLERYYPAYCIMAGGEGISARKAIKRSVQLTSGRLGELFALRLSLLGWKIFDIIIIPRLFTLPYRAVICSLYTRYLTELYDRAYMAEPQADAPTGPVGADPSAKEQG